MSADFLDPHVHFWDPRTTPRAVSALVRPLAWSPRLVDWLARRIFPKDASAFFASPEYVTRPYLPPDLDRDRGAHGLDSVVHVEAGWQGDDPFAPVEETRWLSGLDASGGPRIRGIVARVDLSLGEAAGRVMRAHREASARVCAVRDTLSWHPSPEILNGAKRPHLTQDPAWRAGFEQLSSHGLRFEATVYDHQLAELSALAEAYPDQPIMLSHAGTPIAVGGPFGGLGGSEAERSDIRHRWDEAVARLAACPNVWVKLSGLAMPVCGFGWEHLANDPSLGDLVDHLGPLVEHLIDSFGPGRCCFASNFPVDKVSVSYERLLEGYRAIAAHRPADEQVALFGASAADFYGLEP